MVTIVSNPPATLFNGGKASELSFMSRRASRMAVVDVSATAPRRFGVRCPVGGGVSGTGSDRRLRRIRLNCLGIRAILSGGSVGIDKSAFRKWRGLKNPCYNNLYPPRYLCFLTMGAHQRSQPHRRRLAYTAASTSSCIHSRTYTYTAMAKWFETMKVPYICSLSLGGNQRNANQWDAFKLKRIAHTSYVIAGKASHSWTSSHNSMFINSL